MKNALFNHKKRTMATRVNALREIQSAGEDELRLRRTLLPSVPVLSEVEGLDRAFKGEL